MNTVNTKQIGNRGEDKAVRYLKLRGYRILERNFRSRFGEIDIICEKQKTLVFVEVKSRKNALFGGGASAVNAAKQKRLIKTAQTYLMGNETDREMRFDVIDITGDAVSHIKNAF